MAEKAKAVKTTYTKEGGEVSNRTLLGTMSDNINALDVTDLGVAEREELTKLYNEWLAGQTTFKAFLESQGRSDVAATLKWRSFKSSGLGAFEAL